MSTPEGSSAAIFNSANFLRVGAIRDGTPYKQVPSACLDISA